MFYEPKTTFGIPRYAENDDVFSFSKNVISFDYSSHTSHYRTYLNVYYTYTPLYLFFIITTTTLVMSVCIYKRKNKVFACVGFACFLVHQTLCASLIPANRSLRYEVRHRIQISWFLFEVGLKRLKYHSLFRIYI